MQNVNDLEGRRAMRNDNAIWFQVKDAADGELYAQVARGDGWYRFEVFKMDKKSPYPEGWVAYRRGKSVFKGARRTRAAAKKEVLKFMETVFEVHGPRGLTEVDLQA
jgi:hypothetical protein